MPAFPLTSPESFARDENESEWAGPARPATDGQELGRGALVRLIGRLVAPWSALAEARRRLMESELAGQIRIDRLEREKTALEREVTEARRREGELTRAKETAEAANRAKSDFLAAMSHELRTPLNGLIGLVMLLADSPLNREQRELLRTLDQCGQSMRTLTDDLLDLAKIEAGRLTVESVEFDLAAELQLALDLHAGAAARKGIKLSMDFDRALPARVQGDPLRLRQIVFNLVANAVRFTDRGQVVLRLRFDRPRRGGLQLRGEVIDTGIGIAERAQAALFQPFVQVAPAALRRGGTGLGLAICKRLVERMGGELGVVSTEGVGSVFWFTLEVGHTLAQALSAPNAS